jgi:hypothetical protein
VLAIIKKILEITMMIKDNIKQEQYTQLEANFISSASLLVTVIQKIVTKKNIPHLSDLLLRLNYNNYYPKR